MSSVRIAKQTRPLTLPPALQQVQHDAQGHRAAAREPLDAADGGLPARLDCARPLPRYVVLLQGQGHPRRARPEWPADFCQGAPVLLHAAIPSLTFAGAQLKSRTQEMLAKTYELQFEEDGGLVHSVPASLVVERP